MRRKLFSVAVLLILLPAAGFSTDPMIGRELAFAQIAAGGGWETVLNLTNRGTTTYAGTLSFFNDLGQAWNPVVNGTAVRDGKFDLSLNPGATTTLRVTGSGGLESGFGTIGASHADNTSFVEGTLTYFVKTGDTVVDSVGIQPSSDTYLVTIPFDNFSSITLALANAKSSSAAVTLRLRAASGSSIVASLLLPLQPNHHVAKYLWQLFPDVQITAGRLEIQSDKPVLGTALTDSGGQFSSLPFLPATKAYNYTLAVPGLNGAGVLVCRFNGTAVEVVALDQDELDDPIYWTGTLLDGKLDFGIYDLKDGIFANMVINPFNLSSITMTGSIKLWALDPAEYVGEGRVDLTAIN